MSESLDHPFTPRLAPVYRTGTTNQHPQIVMRDGVRLPPNPWLCQDCGLAEARHDWSTVEPALLLQHPYRCPDCVQTGTDPCPHHWTSYGSAADFNGTEEPDGDHREP